MNRIQNGNNSSHTPNRNPEPTQRKKKPLPEMEKELATLEKGAACCSWNYCGQRIAVGYADGAVAIHDAVEPGAASPSFSRSFKWTVHRSGVMKIIWVPPEFGDAIACISVDGSLSLWEEVEEDTQPLIWKLCQVFETSTSQVLDLQFGVSSTNLKLVAAYSDGKVKVYESLDPLELNKWQLQAEFDNLIDSISRPGKPSCISASIAWNPRRGESQQSSFVLGFNSDTPQFNCSKIWEFEEAHQRWLPIAELASPGDEGDQVHAVAWAPNIGRPYEIIAVATCKGIALWQVGTEFDSDGSLSTEKMASLSGHDGEVWQLEWDMSGMTLASSGDDGMVRLWQSNLNGVWHQQASLQCSGVHH